MGPRFRPLWSRCSRLLTLKLAGLIAIATLGAGCASNPPTPTEVAHNAAVQAAKREFTSQGFELTILYDGPELTLNPDNTTGEMAVITRFPAGWYKQRLLIRNDNGHWIAGCPTTKPGVMYSLDADHNRYGNLLAQTGKCPAGLEPPPSPSTPSPSRSPRG